MDIDEARRILFAASVTWASAHIEFDRRVFEVPSYEDQKAGRNPYQARAQELKLREDILDAAVAQYAAELIDYSVNPSYMPARCPVCGSTGARAYMLDHIEKEHPGKLVPESGEGS